MKSYKPDWDEAKRRLTAMWYGERLDRPCISVQAPRNGSGGGVSRETEWRNRPAASAQALLKEAEPVSLPEPASAEELWMDIPYRLALTRQKLTTTWWGGESIPSCFHQAGWVLCLGGTPRFSRDTIWFETRAVDFRQPSPFRHDPENPWTRRYEKFYLALCAEAGRDGFLVGGPGGLPANDLLSMHMGTQEFLTALMDESDWMAAAILQGGRDQIQARSHVQSLASPRHDFWYGNAGWMPFWAPEPFNSQQSDVSCMLSPEMYERFVLPELDLYGNEYGALWYHLDGGDARQHLPRLLSLPYLRVLQYTAAPFEPPNGPDHLEFYKHVQAAGKIVHIQVSANNVEPLVRELDPSLLMLDTWCSTPEEGEQLLEQCPKWSAGAKSAKAPRRKK